MKGNDVVGKGDLDKIKVGQKFTKPWDSHPCIYLFTSELIINCVVEWIFLLIISPHINLTVLAFETGLIIGILHYNFF